MMAIVRLLRTVTDNAQLAFLPDTDNAPDARRLEFHFQADASCSQEDDFGTSRSATWRAATISMLRCSQRWWRGGARVKGSE